MLGGLFLLLFLCEQNQFNVVVLIMLIIIIFIYMSGVWGVAPPMLK